MFNQRETKQKDNIDTIAMLTGVDLRLPVTVAWLLFPPLIRHGRDQYSVTVEE